MNDSIDRVLLSEREIQRGIEAVARDVVRLFDGEAFTIVSVLKGSCVFTAELIRSIDAPVGLAFAVAESYRDGVDSGRLEISVLPGETEIRGRRILLVDDILDSGATLAAIKRELLQRGASEVRTCVLLDKPARRAVEFEADLAGFEIEDHFVVGFGLDHAGRFRNLPFVAALKPELSLAGSAPAS